MQKTDYINNYNINDARVKRFSPYELAHEWAKDLVTHPNMRKKGGIIPTICKYWVGLWECVARSNP